MERPPLADDRIPKRSGTDSRKGVEMVQWNGTERRGTMGPRFSKKRNDG